MLSELEEAEEEEYTPRPVLRADVADGGYLSWLYGSASFRHAAWPPRFTGRKPLVFMDSRSELFRKQRSPHYKEGREIKRENDPQWKDRTAMVLHFREIVEELDGRFKFVRIEGLEADDLVALAAWAKSKRKPLRVMGIDKDFLQLHPYLTLRDKDNARVTFARFQDKLPKALHYPRITKGWQILITLALLGDKSDSIPRILALRQVGLAFLAALYGYDRERAFQEAYAVYKEKFLVNLYDVILPDPMFFGLSPEETFVLAKNGDWNPGLLDTLPDDKLQELASWRL